MAEEIDVSVPYISELERGAKTLSMKMFIEIANKLDVTADSLLCDSVNKDNNLVSNEITKKLKDCSPETLKTINAFIDAIIKAM